MARTGPGRRQIWTPALLRTHVPKGVYYINATVTWTRPALRIRWRLYVRIKCSYIVLELAAAPAAGSGLGTLGRAPAFGLALGQGLAVGAMYTGRASTDIASESGYSGG